MIHNSKKFAVLAILFLIAFSVQLSMVHGSSAQYVILLPGYDLTGSPDYSDWMSGVNIYQQLVDSGYIVGIVSYYGEFFLNFSNGLSWSDPNFQGTVDTPIESISSELYYALENVTNETGYMNLDIIGYSMGGLVAAYMLENYNIENINLEEFITIATPFDGSPLASLASYLGLDYIIGYQVYEMQPGSQFLQNLQSGWGEIYYLYPQVNFIVYAGNYDPWWGYIFFSGDNDGVVSVNSATYLGYNYLYIFPDLHTSALDSFTWSGISYFEDQNVANTLLSNLQGNF